MRNLKKVMAFVLALALTMSTFTVAFAATSTSASTLGDLGLLSDTSDSSLSAGLTRDIGLVMILKMLGYTQADADAAPAATFTDTEGWLTAWANLAYEKGITKGTNAEGTSFSPAATLTQKDFISLVLRGLGYADTYDDYAEVSATAGLPVDSLTAFTKADAAKVMLAALTATQKDTTDLLINTLIAKGVVTSEAAVAAGLVSDKLAILSAQATSKKEITVKFNRAVEDTSAVTFTAKRDSVNVTFATVTWNDAKTEATLAVSYKLFEGDYVVTVKAGDDTLVSDTFAVEESKVASITFPSDYLVLKNNDTQVTTSVVIKNQYGEDITDDAEGDVNVVPSKAASFTLNDGKITLTAATTYESDQKITITVIDPATAVTETKVFTVSASVDVASITMGDVTTDEDSTTIYVSDLDGSKEYWLPITVLDQYGNEITDAADLQETLTVISSDDDTFIGTNTGVIPPAQNNNDDLITLDEDDNPVLNLIAGADVSDGNVTLTLVSKSGKTATKVVKVVENTEVDTLTLSKPEEVVKKDVAVKIPFVAVDQFGNQLTAAKDGLAITTLGSGPDELVLGSATSKTTIKVTNGTIAASRDYINDDALVIKVTPTSTDKLILTVVTASGKVQTLTMTVNDAPVPTSITGFSSSFYTAMQETLDQTLKTSYVKMIDQYGDDFEFSTDTKNYTLTLKADNSKGKVTIAGGTADVTTAAVTFAAPIDKTGSDKFVLTLKDDSGETVDTYSFTMQNVALSDIDTFGIKDIDKLYTGTDYEFTNNDGTAYDRDVKIFGKIGSTSVYVSQDLLKSVSTTTSGLTFKEDLTAVTDTDARFQFINDDSEVDTDSTDKTATIKALVEGDSLVTCTATVTYSSADPVAQLLELQDSDDDTVTNDTVYEEATAFEDHDVLGTDTAYHFYAEDQYGTEAVQAISYVVTNLQDENDVAIASTTTSISIAKTGVISVTGTALASGDHFTVTAIIDGIVKTIQVVIK